MLEEKDQGTQGWVAATGGGPGDTGLARCYQVQPVVTLLEEEVQGTQGWVAAIRYSEYYGRQKK